LRSSLLRTGDNEVPPIQSNSKGEAEIAYGMIFYPARSTANYKVSVTGFTHAISTHICLGKADSNGEVVYDLLKKSKNNSTKSGMTI